MMTAPTLIRRLAGIAVLLLASIGTSPLAAQGVLEGEVAVPSQEEAIVAKGLGEILRDILIRTGGNEAAEAPAAAAAIDNPTDYVQTWTFRQETVLQGGIPTRLLYLRASFDRRTVLGLLSDGGVQALATDGLPVTVHIEVGPLRSAGDFARSLTALRSLPIMRELSLAEATPERLRLRALVAGGAPALLAGVDEGGVFRPLGTSSMDDATVLLELL
jgi:hypothetical protein